MEEISEMYELDGAFAAKREQRYADFKAWCSSYARQIGPEAYARLTLDELRQRYCDSLPTEDFLRASDDDLT